MVKKNSYQDLKYRFPDYIIIQKAGCFYDVRGFGAIFLSKSLGVTLYSDKASEHKVGIPLKLINKALDSVKEANYKYIVTEHYEIVEQNDNGNPAVLTEPVSELPQNNIGIPEISNNKTSDNRQVYEEYISQIREYILKQNRWVEVSEIERFFKLKRRGKFIEGDNLSTVVHLINRFLKKEGFKTKRINSEYDYSIWVAHIEDIENNDLTNEQPKGLNNPKEAFKFNGILTKEQAREVLELNNCDEYSYDEKLAYLIDKFGSLGEEHTNFQCIGRYGSLNQYILEAFCVLKGFTTRRWTIIKKISKEDLTENAAPVVFTIIKENGQIINYELFNLSQTKAYQENGEILPITEKEFVNSGEDLEDYNKIVKLINKGENIFVTGNAGTGKSFLLNKLKEKYKKKLELTSTTGLAAVNIKGTTIHSWAGVGICKKSIEKCVKDILDKKSLANKIRKCKLLAIDEISMLKGDTFTYIDQVLRMVREDNSPFGGIQLLLFGDFYQLPPVEEDKIGKDFCFATETWQELNLKTIKLEKIYRQSEASFIKALNNIRQNKIDEEDFKLLKSREIDYDTTSSSMLHIFSRNDEADNYNKRKFDSLNSKIYSYKAKSGVYRGDNLIEDNFTERESMIIDIFSKNCKASSELLLKKGCRVMLMINLDFEKGLINGSSGEVIALDDASITVKFDNGIIEDVKVHKFEYYYNDILTASITQFPLRLAYAITIHKSQGMTLENVVVDCNNIFEEGQTYVALSRVKNLNGLYLRGFSLDKIKVNSKVVEFYKNLA